MLGLTTLNVELTSRCQKACFCCGRRKMERDHPDLCDWGDMPFEMVKEIAMQVKGIVVQFHWNGEPTLYPQLGEALALFSHCFRQFDTNSKRIWERAKEIIDNLDVLTISIIQDDTPFETRMQKCNVEEFIKKKGDRKPRLVYRCLGDVDTKFWDKLPGLVVTRTLHDPMGSFNYKKTVPIPEIGVCLEMMNHLAIDRYGNVSPCVRFDPYGENRIGNLNEESLSDIWYGEKRQRRLQEHIEGRREGFCSKCDYWGVIVA